MDERQQHDGRDVAHGERPEERYLRIYLNDHRSGAAAGLSLARRSAERNRGAPFEATLREVAEEIAADVDTLEQVIDHLGVQRSRIKQVLGEVAERIGRLKLNGQLSGYSPLSRLLELEGLLAGIDAKRSLWVALAEGEMSNDLARSGIDLHQLARRAESQRERLQPLHREAARAVWQGQDTSVRSAG